MLQEQLTVPKTDSKEISGLLEGLELAKRLNMSGQIETYRDVLTYYKAKLSLEERGFKVVKLKRTVEIEGEEFRMWTSNYRHYDQELMPVEMLESIEKHQKDFDNFEIWYPGQNQKDPLLIGVKRFTKGGGNPSPRGAIRVYALLGVWG